MGGIPSKKPEFRLAEKNCDYASCVLEGSVLYIWYERRSGESLRNCLKKIDLNSFSGVEEVSYDGENVSTWASALHNYDEYLCVSGGLGAVFKKDDLSPIYVETDDYISLNGWDGFSSNFLYEGKFYRAIDASGKAGKGFDVIDISTWSLVGHVDIDFKDIRVTKKGMCCGVRDDFNFSVYSLVSSEILFELNVLDLVGSENVRDGRVAYSMQGDLVVLLYKRIVIVIDLNDFSVVREVNYLLFGEVVSKLAEVGLDLSRAIMSGIDFSGDDIVLNSSRGAICISVSQGSVRWVNLYPNSIEFSGSCISGDIIFGVKDSRPIAWDRYTGEDVWAASNCLPCKEIQAGDGWLVYSQVCGHIACYRWKKPYISPHRPQA